MSTSISPFTSNYGMGAPHVPPPSEHVDSVVLPAGVPVLINKPAGAGYVTFGSTGVFFAKPDAIPEVPTDDVTGAASECNPHAWRLSSGIGAIGLVAPAACTVTLAYHR